MKKYFSVLIVLTLLVCALCFPSVTTQNAYAVETNETFIDPYNFNASSRIMNAPAVICDVVDADALASLSNEKKPSNAILHIDDDFNVVDKDGEVLGAFLNIYNEVLKGKIIPVVYLENQKQRDELELFLEKDLYIYDMAVMSHDATLVNYVRSRRTMVRGIIDYSKNTDDSLTLYDIVKTTNENKSLVAVLPDRLVTAENIRYIHARFKTVWTYGGNTADSIRKAIHTGTYGIITDKVSEVFDVYSTYETKALTRTPFNVAHRGLPATHNENSCSGLLAAINAGASHVELDAYITTDGQIVFMHDSTLDRTTNGTGNIESFSLAYLDGVKLDVHGIEKIPTFDDVAAILKQHPDVVMVFEIKSWKTSIVTALKEQLTKHDLWDQVVVISFADTIIAEMARVLPQVPTAYLNFSSNWTRQEVFEFVGLYTTGVDVNYGEAGMIRTYNEQFLRDRGVVGWYWTFADESAVNTYTNNGCVGLTNNAGDKFPDLPVKIEGVEGEAFYLGAGGDSLTVNVTNAKGETKQSVAVAGAVIDKGDYWLVSAIYNVYTAGYYTDYFKVNKTGDFTNEEREAVVSVKNTINLLPQKVENKPAHKSRINAARKAYDALSAECKTLITNYDKLVAAETALNNLLNPDNSQNQGGSGNENTEENTSSCGTVVPVDGNGNGGGGLGIAIIACTLALLAFFVAKKKIRN
ncbi:MAG: hypothetical protein J6B79_03400 [Clostridia bacterium]|nr:hypothetical protein [Clostridia bacterium]